MAHVSHPNSLIRHSSLQLDVKKFRMEEHETIFILFMIAFFRLHVCALFVDEKREILLWESLIWSRCLCNIQCYHFITFSYVCRSTINTYGCARENFALLVSPEREKIEKISKSATCVMQNHANERRKKERKLNSSCSNNLSWKRFLKQRHWNWKPVRERNITRKNPFDSHERRNYVINIVEIFRREICFLPFVPPPPLLPEKLFSEMETGK